MVLKLQVQNLVFENVECKVLIITDVSDLIKFNHTMRQVNDIMALTETVSHEMRNPLLSIRSMVSIL